MATLEKLIQTIMSGTQDKNIKFADLQKILDVLGFKIVSSKANKKYNIKI